MGQGADAVNSERRQLPRFITKSSKRPAVCSGAAVSQKKAYEDTVPRLIHALQFLTSMWH